MIELLGTSYYPQSAKSHKKRRRTQRPVFLFILLSLTANFLKFGSLIKISESLGCPTNKPPFKFMCPPVMTDRKNHHKTLLDSGFEVWVLYTVCYGHDKTLKFMNLTNIDWCDSCEYGSYHY